MSTSQTRLSLDEKQSFTNNLLEKLSARGFVIV